MAQMDLPACDLAELFEPFILIQVRSSTSNIIGSQDDFRPRSNERNLLLALLVRKLNRHCWAVGGLG